MLNWLTKRARRKRNAHDIYGSIVALSRSPALYTQFGIPDTLEARFEALLLHVILFVSRVRHSDEDAEPMAQEIVDLFFADLDTTSRELGVGDLTVPKKMRKLATVYQDRIAQYGNAIVAEDRDDLSKEFKQIVYHDDESAERHATMLADYARNLMRELMQTPLEELRCVHERINEQQE
ncbi:MAG: ubiquinol-cytochrome C chaperone [Hyphomicrobiaceae bacterium]|nr:ubiquinol-cytochrome C chaperone [Hyphomicrobiaceae bacterium]